MSATVSNSRAILIGTLWVNIPVLAIMFGGWGVPLLLIAYFAPPYSGTPVAGGPSLSATAVGFLLAFWLIGPFVAAWTWWSVQVPRWRVWALKRTGDWPSLERAAILVGLIWDERSSLGRLFARTEFWTASLRAEETEFLEAKGLPARARARQTT